VSDCVDRNRLDLMLRDQLHDRERDSVEGHVESCVACQQVLDELTSLLEVGLERDALSTENGFLSRVKRIALPPDIETDPEPISSPPTLGEFSSLPSIAGFRMIREVGRGGMGTVYEAIELALDRRVALKVLPRSAALSRTAIERFRRESRATAQLHHTNIVPVFGVGDDDAYLYHALQFIDGESLDKLLARTRQGDVPHHAIESPTIASETSSRTLAEPTTPSMPAPLTAGDSCPCQQPSQAPRSSGSDPTRKPWFRYVARIGIQVAEGLDFAHRKGILHRDVKPSNILIDQSGTAWVADFGLAKSYQNEGETLTQHGEVVGTLRYLPPERFDGLSDVLGDVYSLGTTLYELLTLRPAFDASDRVRVIEQVSRGDVPRPRSIDRRIPIDLETITMKAMARDRAARYQSAAAVAEDLRRYLAGEPILARRAGIAKRSWRWARRNPAVAGLISAVIMATAVGFALTSAQTYRAIKAESDMARQRDRANDARNDARRLAADLTIDRGLALLDRGEVITGRHWLARGLQTPEIAPPSARVARLNLAAWDDASMRLIQVIAGPEPFHCVSFDADGTTLHALSADRKRIHHFDPQTALERDAPAPVSIDDEGEPILEFCHGGRTLLCLTRGSGSLRFFDAATGAARCEPVPTSRSGAELRLSPDGDAVAYPTGIDSIQVLSASTHGPLGPPIHIDATKGSPYALGPHGRTLLTFGARGGQMWDVATGRLERSVPSMANVYLAGFNQEGEFYTLKNENRSGGGPQQRNEIEFRDARGLPLTSPLAIPNLAGSRRIAWSRGGKTLAVHHEDGSLRLYHRDQDRAVRVVSTGLEGGTMAAMSPDGTTIAQGTRHGRVRLFDVLTGGSRTGDLIHPGRIQELQFSPDGRLLQVFVAGSAWIWQLPNRPQPVARPAGSGVEFGRDLGQAVFARDAESFMILAPNHSDARIVDRSGQPTGRLMPMGYELNPLLAVAADGRRWASASHDHWTDSEIRLWDRRGNPVGDPLQHENWISQLAFSPSGRTLAATGYAEAVWLFDAANGGKASSTLAARGIGMCLAYSRDGKTLAVGTSQSWSNQPPGIQLWDPEAGRKPRLAVATEDWPRFFEFCPDARSLLVFIEPWTRTASLGSYQLWDAATLKPRSERLPTSTQYRGAIAFLPGDRLLTQGPGGIWEWDIAAGRPIRVVIPLGRSLRSIAVNPAGTWIAVLTSDGDGRLYETQTYRPVGPPLRAEQGLVEFAFSSDGKSILGAVQNASLREWPVPDSLLDDDKSLPTEADAVLLATGATLDPSSDAIHPLSAAEWRNYRKLGPRAPRSPTDNVAAWHARCADGAEAEGNGFAARWHLDRLAPYRPGDWTIHARRARAFAEAGAFDLAAQEFAIIAGAEGLVDWRISTAAAARAAGRTDLALWYFDRILADHPNHWEAFARRAEIHDAMGRQDLSRADLKLATDLGMDLPTARRFSDRLALQGLWRQAAEVLAPLDARTANFPLAISTRLAHAALLGGDQDAYRDTCSRLLARAGGTDPKSFSSNYDINNTLYVLTCGPRAVDDYRGPIALLQTVVDRLPPGPSMQRHFVLNTMGALLYRAGDPAGAIRALRDGVGGDIEAKFVAQDWAFMALASHALGDFETARLALRRLEASPIQTLHVWQRAEILMLQREANALVNEVPDSLPQDVFASPR
jgi:serine/threonine protein kinase/WD40 repeat protein